MGIEKEKLAKIKEMLRERAKASGYCLVSDVIFVCQINGIKDFRLYAPDYRRFAERYLVPDFTYTAQMNVNGRHLTGVLTPADNSGVIPVEESTVRDIDPEILKQIRDYLNSWLERNDFFNCGSFPQLAGMYGISNFRDYAKTVPLFMAKYFKSEFKIEYNVDDGSGAIQAAVIKKGAGKSALGSSIIEHLSESEVSAIKQYVAEVTTQSDGFLNFGLFKKHLVAMGYADFEDSQLARELIDAKLVPDYHFFRKYRVNGELYRQAVIVSKERIEKDYPYWLNNEVAEMLRMAIDDALEEKRFLDGLGFVAVIKKLKIDHDKYTPSLAYMAYRYLPETKIYRNRVINGVNYGFLLVAANNDLKNIVAEEQADNGESESTTTQLAKYDADTLSREMINRIKNQLNETLSNKSYLETVNFASFLKKFGIEDYHRYADTIEAFTEKYLKPEFVYQRKAILPEGEHVTVIAPTQRMFLTEDALKKMKEIIAQDIDHEGFYYEAKLAFLLRDFGITDYRLYAVKVSKFVERFFEPEFIHEGRYSLPDGRVQLGVIIRPTEAQKEEAAEKKSGENLEHFLATFLAFDETMRLFAVNGIIPYLPEADVKRIKGVIGNAGDTIYGDKNESKNVQINIGQITNSIGTIMSGAQGQELLGAFRQIPNVIDYASDKKLLEGEIAGERAEEELSRSSDKLANDLREAIIVADEPTDDFVIWNTLGISEEEYKELHQSIDGWVNDDLYFAARIDSIFKYLDEDKTINEKEKDYSAVTIMYCKIVERMLREYHSSLYMERIPQAETGIPIKGRMTCFGDLDGDDGTLIRSRLTINSFLTPIAGNNKTNRSDLARDGVKTDANAWTRQANMLFEVKETRNQSAHGEMGKIVAKGELVKLKKLLFNQGGVKRIVELIIDNH